MQFPMEVVDNFLEENAFLKLQQAIISDNFPVFYQPDGVGVSTDDGSDIRIINFTHNLYTDGEARSSFYNFVAESLFSKYNINKIIRAKVNCYPRTSRIVRHPFHYDFDYSHKGALFYLNTCNGRTKFKSGPRVKSVANRVLFFDPLTLHASTSCTDQRCRWNIQVNYF